MKFQMMMNILFLLLSRKKVSASYIAKRYNVCIRSVYRYIDELSLAGIPIYSERGRNGGISIYDDYKLPSTFFSKEELSVLNSSLVFMNKQFNDANIQSILDKLNSNNKNDSFDTNISFNNLIIDNSGWGKNTIKDSQIQIVMKSIENNNLISIKYQDRDEEISTREIEPHIIILKQGLWYVYAFCRLRNDFRFFKINRIINIKILDVNFDRKKIDKDAFIKTNWFEQANSTTVDFKFNELIKNEIEDWLGINAIHSNNSEYYASVKLPIDKGLINKILSFGKNLEVLSPKSLKQELKKVVLELNKMYS